ncbi:DUF2220 family protein [Chitinophaga horti]|uniref:DUF2220 family protein n=1 Tax=Chitinophaga horti TaxID=2920382 RepID=A0ABY6IZN9_9BACT|nr:Wadjet anti-phage system protein JetD domain-containing protein [Chitinophaga horti]UYQ92840.1 DUF2220 family protein [Chitinophaga horti]
MITPNELLAKADKLFFRIVSSQLKGENSFPLNIPANKQFSGSNFSDWKNDLLPLYQQSKKERGKGYSIDWKERTVNGSKQSVPVRIYFDTMEDFLHFTKRELNHAAIQRAYANLSSCFPALKQWAAEHPAVLLEQEAIWEDVIKVCSYFTSHAPPHPYYIRELPIEVHSKFIEQNSQLLRKLLDILLPPEAINISSNDFSQRYHLKKIAPYTQIRILDDALKPHLGYDECSLSLEDAAWLQWVPEYVFIIENQTCFITFPKMKNAVAIFGEGFKSRLSRHLPWLAKTKLFCWFDLDAAGFEMVNMVRESYPDAECFLMDAQTYAAFDRFAVTNKNKPKQLPLLHADEKRMYKFLTQNSKRLEQERIPQKHVTDSITML